MGVGFVSSIWDLDLDFGFGNLALGFGLGFLALGFGCLDLGFWFMFWIWVWDLGFGLGVWIWEFGTERRELGAGSWVCLSVLSRLSAPFWALATASSGRSAVARRRPSAFLPAPAEATFVIVRFRVLGCTHSLVF